MSIQIQDINKSVRNVAYIGLRDSQGRFRKGIGLKMNVNGELRTIWEPTAAFIFTSDGFGLVTKDGYIVKAKDQ